MRLDGTLNDYPLADLFQLIFMGKRTGTLLIFSGGDEGTIIFGDNLVHSAITKKNKGLRAVREILSWNHGKFVFDTEDATVLGDEAKIGLPIQQFILGLSTEMDECDDLMAKIGGEDKRLLLVPIAPKNNPVNLTPIEWQVVVHIGDAPTLGELKERVSISERDLLRTIMALRDRSLLNIE